MTVYQLGPRPVFPNPALAEPEGLLAMGGDLSLPRLLAAYSNGIFPWYSDGQPLLWWSPDPRMVLFPEEFHRSRRLARTIRQGHFHIRADHAFTEVISACAHIPRRYETGTWIVPEMITAYTALHEAGYAHSIEVWCGGTLAGGLYGVSIGKCFFGESMFSRRNDASKVAFHALAERCREWEFALIDCQFWTSHLESLGAREIPRHQYLAILERACEYPTKQGSWAAFFGNFPRLDSNTDQD